MIEPRQVWVHLRFRADAGECAGRHYEVPADDIPEAQKRRHGGTGDEAAGKRRKS